MTAVGVEALRYLDVLSHHWREATVKGALVALLVTCVMVMWRLRAGGPSTADRVPRHAPRGRGEKGGAHVHHDRIALARADHRRRR